MPDTQFKKHFTVEEANALIPYVLSAFEHIHAHTAELEKQKPALEKLHERAPANGGSKKGAKLLEISMAITHLVSGLEEKGIIIKDILTGLTDFPHMRKDREVLLCWRMGEKEVGFWHEIETGFKGRQPL